MKKKLIILNLNISQDLRVGIRSGLGTPARLSVTSLFVWKVIS